MRSFSHLGFWPLSLLLHLLFLPWYVQVSTLTCGKSLCTQVGIRRAQAACSGGQSWGFFLLLFVLLRPAEEGGHPWACREFSHVFYCFLDHWGFLGVEVGSHHFQRWLIFWLADQQFVRCPLLSVWVCPERLLGPSKGEALCKMNKHQKHKIVKAVIVSP